MTAPYTPPWAYEATFHHQAAEIMKLKALVRMQHEALSAIYIYRHGQKVVDWERIDEALAAYERFDNGE
jgi:hypothetical protein